MSDPKDGVLWNDPRTGEAIPLMPLPPDSFRGGPPRECKDEDMAPEPSSSVMSIDDDKMLEERLGYSDRGGARPLKVESYGLLSAGCFSGDWVKGFRADEL